MASMSCSLKKSSHIIKNDVFDGVMKFFDTTFCHNPVNSTLITLVPKVENASFAKDYITIAFCSVAYKLISKILTIRLQQVITEVVSCS